MPAAGNAQASFFVLGLAKAGSTLFNRVMRPLSAAAGYSFFSIRNTLADLGVPPESVDFEASDPMFVPQGFCYGGFRGLPGDVELPDFGKGRSVLLVRDPRDMLTSLYFSVAYSHRPPPSQQESGMADVFNQQRQAALGSSIDEYALKHAPIVLRSFEVVGRKTARLSPKTYRYEDVIFSKLGWIEDVVRYLELEVPERLVATIVERNDVRPGIESAGEHIRRVTPGDHREKLAPETISQLNEILAPVLSRYGYA
jgi:hypothetical protein